MLGIPDWDIKWGTGQKGSLALLNEDLSNPSLLAAHESAKKKMFMTDESNHGLGGVPIQIEEEGICRSVAFTSRKINMPELKYTVTKNIFLPL